MKLATREAQDGYEPLVLCPDCGSEHTHLMAVAGVPGWDRRLDAVLNFTCESGHAWEMRLAQHKGYTEIFIEESV